MHLPRETSCPRSNVWKWLAQSTPAGKYGQIFVLAVGVS